MIDTNILRAVILTLISPVVIANYLLAEQLTRAADIPKTHNPQSEIKEDYGRLSLYFILNAWQLDEQVKYYERGSGHAMFFTEEGVYLSPTAGSGLQPEPSGLLNTDVCANDVISKDINTGVQVANLNPQKDSMQRPLAGRYS